MAAVATVFTTVTDSHLNAGDSAADALRRRPSWSALLLAIMSAAGVGLALLVARAPSRRPRAIDWPLPP